MLDSFSPNIISTEISLLNLPKVDIQHFEIDFVVDGLGVHSGPFVSDVIPAEIEVKLD